MTALCKATNSTTRTPCEATLKSLGELIHLLANDTVPLRWEMQITIGKCGHTGLALALDRRLSDHDKQFILTAATRIANLDHA